MPSTMTRMCIAESPSIGKKREAECKEMRSGVFFSNNNQL
jgi:hypothetical protein